MLKSKEKEGNGKIITSPIMKRSATTKIIKAKIEEDQTTEFSSKNQYNDIYLH